MLSLCANYPQSWSSVRDTSLRITLLNTYIAYKSSGLGFDERDIAININAIDGAFGHA